MAYALDLWAPSNIDNVPIAAAAEASSPDSRLTTHDARVVSPQIYDEDEPLLNRLAADDEAAFRILVERHIDRAFGIALRIVGSRADAEDVVQDTLLKVWTHRGRWQHGRAKFSTWLYRVITNRCIDLRRQPRS